MSRLRTRLILAFLAATLGPLAATLWVTSWLLERSLSYSSTRELDEISRSLERTGREFYQRAREALREAAKSGRLRPERFLSDKRGEWPAEVEQFFSSADAERFLTGGEEGNRLDLLVRRDGGVWRYSQGLGQVAMGRLARQYADARETVEAARSRDLRRGLLYTFLVLAAGVWAVSLALLAFSAHRISKPIRKLTAGLAELAAGNLSVRVEVEGGGEIGRAVEAFNHTAEQLERSREKLVFVTRLASWQALGRKMAHELKNSLTPIRLTAEELVARRGGAESDAIEQAAQIIVDEVNRLEKRVRAFSELAAEPPVRMAPLEANAIVEERAGFLRAAHPEVVYTLRLDPSRPHVLGDEDLLRAVLTNLLENAAEAAGPGGVVLAVSAARDGKVYFEVHDSGPGLSMHARGTLFEPTISFKKSGMGLGLSIARKSALLSGGDITLIQGELGGAAFRVEMNACAAPEPAANTKEPCPQNVSC